MVNDEPAFLPVGTEVSAKYKGAFCEAKIKRVQRSVKCRVSFKSMLGGTVVVGDDQVRGSLKVGALIEAKHPDKPGVYQEATVTKIIDQSQYTVVFDDGDVTTLRRNSLCLKSGKHYSDGESLDQLPLTNPEHFSAPVAPGSVGSSGGSGNGSSAAQTRDSPAGKALSSGSAQSQRKKRTAASLGEFLCREGGAADGGSSQEDDELEATTPRRKRQQQQNSATNSNNSAQTQQQQQSASQQQKTSRSSSRESVRGLGGCKVPILVGSVVLVEAERREEKTPRGGGASETHRGKRDALAAPALIVREQSGARKDEVRVKLFRDGQMVTVSKKDIQEFDRKQTSLKGHPQKSAIFKALLYLEKGDLPQGWSRKELLDENAEDKDDDNPADDDKDSKSKGDDKGKDEESSKDSKGDKDSDSKGDSDEDESDSEDEVSSEERDRFVAQLYKFMEERGTPINKGPVLNGKDIDLHQLFSLVRKVGSFDKVTNLNRWRDVYAKMFKEPKATPAQGQQLKGAYKKYLQGFEDLYRKLGMDSHLDAKASGSGGARSQRIMTRNKQPPLSAVKAGGRQERKAVTPPQPPDSPSSASSGKRERLQQQQQQQQQQELQKQQQQLQQQQEQQKQQQQQQQQQELQKQQKQQQQQELQKQQKQQQQQELQKQQKQQQQQELQKQQKQQQQQELQKQQKQQELQKQQKQQQQQELQKQQKQQELQKQQKQQELQKQQKQQELQKQQQELQKQQKQQQQQQQQELQKQQKQQQQQELQKQQKQQQQQQEAQKQQQEQQQQQEAQKQQQEQQEAQKQQQQQQEQLQKLTEKATTEKDAKESKEVAVKEDEEKRSLTRSNKRPEDREAAGLTTPKRVRSDSLDPAKRAKEKASALSASKESKAKVEEKDRIVGTPVSMKKDRRKDKGSDSEESEIEVTPSTRKNVLEPLRVNDRIRVKYGHGKQHKVYEAKVLKIEDAEGDSGEKKLFVHYTGWNNRYDEWIYKKRILENITHKLDKGRAGSVSARKAPAPPAASGEREKRDDKESSSSSSEKSDSKSSESSKDLKDKDGPSSKDKDIAVGGVVKKKEEDSSEEPRKRRGKPPKKFAESNFEVHMPTRKDAAPQGKESSKAEKDVTASKSASDSSGVRKDEDTKEKELSPSKRSEAAPGKEVKEEKSKAAKDEKVCKDSKDSKELPAIVTGSGVAQAKTGAKEERKEAPVAESPAPAPVKKLVEVSPEHAARVFAVKSKPPESGPPPVPASVQGTPGVSTTTTPPVAGPVAEKGKEREVPLAAAAKDKESKDSVADAKKERPAEDEPAGKEKPSTPKRARLAKRKKPATPSSEKVDKVQKIDRTEDKSDGSAPADKSVANQASSPIKTQVEETRQASPIVKAEQSEGEDTDIEKDPVVPTLLPLPTTASGVGPSSKESQSVEDDDNDDAADQEALKAGEGGPEEEASTEVEEGHLEDSLADNQSMNLDESGIEALEQETPVPPPDTSEDVVPRAASPAATSTPAPVEERRTTSRAPIEASASPITTKTRKPRARRVSESRDEERDISEAKEKESKERRETAKAVDKDERPEEKKPVTATKSRSRKISENQVDDETVIVKKRTRKVSEMTLSPAAKTASPQKDESKITEAASLATSNAKITADETKEPEPTVKHAVPVVEDKPTEVRIEAVVVRHESQITVVRPVPKEVSSTSGNVGLEKDKPKEAKEKSTKETKGKDTSPCEGRPEPAPVHYLPKKRRIQQKLDEEASASPAAVVVVAKKSKIEEQPKVEITVKQESKEADAVSDTSEEKMQIAEDTEDGGDEYLDAKNPADKLLTSESAQDSCTLLGLSKESTSGRTIDDKDKDCTASKESQEKERLEEKERAAAGDALAALADACGEAEAVKEQEGPSEAVGNEIKQEEHEADADGEGADGGEQAGGLFLICEENVLPESPVPHNHGQANHGDDNQDGAGPADGVVVLGGGRLGEMPSACCVTEVTPPTTPDDSQSSGNSHQSNNNNNNNNSHNNNNNNTNNNNSNSNNLSNNTGNSSTTTTDNNNSSNNVARNQHVVNPSTGAGVATSGSGVPSTPADRRVASAGNMNEKGGDKAGEPRIGGGSTEHGSAGNAAAGPDEESTMSADSSDSARQSSAVEREREKSVRGSKGGGLSGGTRGGRMKRTRKTLRQKAQQGQAQRRAGAERARSPTDGHLFSGGLRGSDRDGAPPGSCQGGAGQLGRHAGLLCTQMPPNYDPAKPPRFNFSLSTNDIDDAEERITLIQDKLCELKKKYMELKTEVALIDRKRKRIRRREAARAENNISNSPRPHPSPLRTASEN